MLRLPHQPARRLPMPTMSSSELTKLSHTLARALSVDQVNQLGRDTGQAERLRTVTPHRLFLAIVTDGTQSQSGPTFQREQPFEFGDGRTSGHTIGHVLTHHGAVLETRYERRLGPEPLRHAWLKPSRIAERLKTRSARQARVALPSHAHWEPQEPFSSYDLVWDSHHG